MYPGTYLIYADDINKSWKVRYNLAALLTRLLPRQGLVMNYDMPHFIDRNSNEIRILVALLSRHCNSVQHLILDLEKGETLMIQNAVHKPPITCPLVVNLGRFNPVLRIGKQRVTLCSTKWPDSSPRVPISILR